MTLREELEEIEEALVGSSTIFRIPSFFSCDEKYGENRKTCRSRFWSSSSANCPSCSRTSSITPFSDATSNSAFE